jgi:alanine-synthesizing transaminase
MEHAGDFIQLADRMNLLPPYLFGRLNRIKQEKRGQGIDVIDLAMGNPNDPTPGPVVEKLCEVVCDSRNHRYSVASGIYNLRREIARYYENQYGVSLRPIASHLHHRVQGGVSHLSLALLGRETPPSSPCGLSLHVYSAVSRGRP